MIDKRCSVCSRLIAVRRQSTFPHARTCGARTCFLENRRRVHNDLALLTKRRRLGKTPAVREPIEAERGATHTFLSAVRRTAAGALTRAARAFGAFCSG